jgi:hypothetical protein
MGFENLTDKYNKRRHGTCFSLALTTEQKNKCFTLVSFHLVSHLRVKPGVYLQGAPPPV